jgi:hypothetical protein
LPVFATPTAKRFFRINIGVNGMQVKQIVSLVNAPTIYVWGRVPRAKL